MHKTLAALLVSVSLITVLSGCEQFDKPDLEAMIAKGAQYDVRILRDTWGVPHVFGKTDADVGYGIAFAHCEDDFETIQDFFTTTRSRRSYTQGVKEAPIDFMVQILRVRDFVDEKYETDLSPEVRALCEAAADGLNHYAALHPGKMAPGVYPATGKDLVAGFTLVSPMFFGLDNVVKRLFGDSRPGEVSVKTAMADLSGYLTQGLHLGSNTFSVGPDRSADGKTRININSHQPLTGPLAWYEAHLHSEEGWDCAGGMFPGAPVILHGHNRNLGWAHTVNRPDLVDVYKLEINPDDLNQYKFDGEWRNLDVREIAVKVRIFGPLRWTIKRDGLWSVHGPVIRQKHGTYAIRYGGMGEIHQVEQWYRMNKADNLDEWMDAVRLQGLASFNIGYADKEGNIGYVYNARFPIRAEGYDWTKILPGNTSETLWTEYLPFDKLPRVLNPPSGFVQNCNSSPFNTTIGEGNPNPDDFSPTLGIEPLMTNRAVRALELLGADESITEEEFYAYKYDTAYSKNHPVADMIKEILDTTQSDDPVVVEALDAIRSWDLNTNKENTSAAISVLVLEPMVRAMYFDRKRPDLAKLLTKNAHALKDAFGKVAVPWAEVNRLRRGDRDVALAGGPDCLRAVYGSMGNDGRIVAHSGDCYVLIAAFDENGVTSRSIHQFGSATLDASSPHYADQMPLFAEFEMKPVWMDEADIRANLEREYRPGE